jgi:hypothetical protein
LKTFENLESLPTWNPVVTYENNNTFRVIHRKPENLKTMDYIDINK